MKPRSIARDAACEAGPFQAGMTDPISHQQGFGARFLNEMSPDRDPG